MDYNFPVKFYTNQRFLSFFFFLINTVDYNTLTEDSAKICTYYTVKYLENEWQSRSLEKKKMVLRTKCFPTAHLVTSA